MLFLLFQLGDDRYALDVRQIVEILPCLGLKRIPQAPQGVAGLLNYHGAPVPVIDLSALALGRDAVLRMSTRLILVRYPGPGEGNQLLGLMAEQATETARFDAADFVPGGIGSPEAGYLGPVTSHAGVLVQRIEIAGLLTDKVKSLLFEPLAATP